jgi:hypothetical protein
MNLYLPPQLAGIDLSFTEKQRTLRKARISLASNGTIGTGKGGTLGGRSPCEERTV